MKFPSTQDTDTHASAALRLKAARTHQAQAAEDHREAPDEPRASMTLRQADAEVAAREAWVEWVERPF